MITINIWNIVFLILVALAIGGILPDDYKHEIGTGVLIILEIIWIIVWMCIFPILGHQITFK